MNEFEWRRQLHDLRQPLTPQRDLWASIDAALDAAEPANASTSPAVPHHQARRRWQWLVAASLAASVLLVSSIGWQRLHAPTSTPIASTAAIRWKPADPRLAGAAIELDAARMELQQAIQQSPHSPALQRLLSRTEHQQSQLRQQSNQAG